MPLGESFLLSRQAKSCRPKTIDWYRMILGHETAEMTRRYVRLFARDYIEAHHQHTPRRLLAGGWQQEMFQEVGVRNEEQ